MTALDSRPLPDARATAARWLNERATSYGLDARRMGKESPRGKVLLAVAVELADCAREIAGMAVR